MHRQHQPLPRQLRATQSPSAAPTNAPVPAEPADTSKGVHEGTRNDVDAIGNRHVGCDKGLGNWYSLEKQIAMGKSFAQQVESQSKMVNDPVITEYVNRLGQNLVRNSDSQVPFTIKVIDSDDINAFALPGGFFYINSGLILAADEEAELAGVMAHEIAHVAACHAAREYPWPIDELGDDSSNLRRRTDRIRRLRGSWLGSALNFHEVLAQF